MKITCLNLVGNEDNVTAFTTSGPHPCYNPPETRCLVYLSLIVLSVCINHSFSQRNGQASLNSLYLKNIITQNYLPCDTNCSMCIPITVQIPFNTSLTSIFQVNNLVLSYDLKFESFIAECSDP